MKNEIELSEYLKKHYPDLTKQQDQYSSFDYTSEIYKEYIELKCRYKHYEDLMIEKSKYERVCNLAFKYGYKPSYICSTPKGIYKFNLSGKKSDWTNELCPLTTQFGNTDKVLKEVGFISIKKSIILHTF
jgi:hypothetical protein